MVLKTDLNYDIPIDIQDEDVNEIFYIIDNESEALDLFCKIYNVNRDEMYKQLHEFDNMREEFRKENYLRSCNINDKCLMCQFYNKCGGFYRTDSIDETYCPFNITEENNDFVLYDIALEKYKERMMTNE